MALDRFVHCHTHSEYSILDGLNGPYTLVRTAGNLGQPALALTDHGRLSGTALFWDAIKWYNECHAERHAYDPEKCHAKPKEDEAGCHAVAECANLERCPIGKAGTLGPEAHAVLPPIKGILGLETYVADAGRTSREKGDWGHLVLLAENQTGWNNLRALASLASIEGFYSKPRIDWELLERYHEGLIALSACLGGHLARKRRAEGDEATDALIVRYRDLFGPEHYYLELQWHNDQDLGGEPGQHEQADLNRYLLGASARFAVPCVVTNDLHYARREDAALEEVLLANQQQMTLAQVAEAKAAGKSALSFDTPDFYLKSRTEMQAALTNWYRQALEHEPETAALLKAHAAEWLDASLAIAERVSLETPFPSGLHFPIFPLPEGETSESYLAQRVREKAPTRWATFDEQRRRLVEYELQCINELGFAPYFLITEDFVEYARRENIEVGLGRGSAPGSVITYVLGITDIDPVAWGLTAGGIGLTRFLNPTVLYHLEEGAFGTLPPEILALPLPTAEAMETELAAALNIRVREHTAALKEGRAGDPRTGEVWEEARLEFERKRWPELKRLLVEEWTLIKRYGEANDQAKRTNKLAARASAQRHSLIVPLWRWWRHCQAGGGPGAENAHHSLIAKFLGLTTAPVYLLTAPDGGKELSFLPIYEFTHSRKSMPDIDIDFERGVDGREKVIRYVIDKYGADHVCQISTFGTMLAKSAVKDVARAKGLSPELANELTALIPGKFSASDDEEGVEDEDKDERVLRRMISSENAGVAKDSAALRERMAADPQVDEVIRLAARLEGTKRTEGTHACGVLITPRPVTDYVSVRRVKEKDRENRAVQAVHDGPTLTDKLGLLKVDFLGLKNLSVNKGAVERIRERRGISVDWRRPAIDDQPALALLRAGRTEGIFQFNKNFATSVLKQIKPRRTADLMVATALGRPGPAQYIPTYVASRARGTVVYGDPVFERLAKRILDPTYGVLVYQEQVMLLGIEVADFTQPESDGLRKATAKKDKALLASWREKFVEGAVRKGVNRGFIEHYWDQTLTPFAEYSFNQSHATAYGFTAYTQAVLKAHYLPEFMAALMSVEQHEGAREKGGSPPIVQNIVEGRRLGMEMLPIDINCSTDRIEIEDLPEVGEGPDRRWDKVVLRMSLGAVKGIGGRPVEAILAERTAHGPFSDFGDFLRRNVETERETDAATGRKVPVAVNKTAVINLLKVGSFDAFDDRGALLERAEAYFGTTSVKKRAAIDWTPIPAAQRPGQPPRDYLDWERELLGFYVSAHPVASIPPAALQSFLAAQTAREELRARRDGKPARELTESTVADALVFDKQRDSEIRIVRVVVSAAEYKPTRTGRPRYTGKIEDETGSCAFVYWGPRENDTREATEAWEAWKAAMGEMVGEGLLIAGGFTYHERWQNPGGVVIEAWQRVALPRLAPKAVAPKAAVKAAPATVFASSKAELEASLSSLFDEPAGAASSAPDESPDTSVAESQQPPAWSVEVEGDDALGLT